MVHPNPSFGISDIEFRLPQDSKVNLKLFDTSGRMIVHRIKDQVYGEGYHRVELASQELSSGIYLIELRAVNEVRTIKWIKL